MILETVSRGRQVSPGAIKNTDSGCEGPCSSVIGPLVSIGDRVELVKEINWAYYDLLNYNTFLLNINLGYN